MKLFIEQFQKHFLVKIIIAVIMFLYVFSTQAQVAKSSVLYKTLKLKDSIIFERTFNLCETEKLEPIIATNFEFYHDVGGIQNREEFIKAVKNNICINPGNFTRQLVANSLEVFPLKKNGILYGAIQRGKHTFQEKNNGEMKTVGIARFTHVWILENKKWKLKRVLSFDHNPYSE